QDQVEKNPAQESTFLTGSKDVTAPDPGDDTGAAALLEVVGRPRAGRPRVLRRAGCSGFGPPGAVLRARS
ncbi:hypothetical protein, partial [Streptomyces sp. NPDC005568]|uniref:hypothetical protein n=1 Tax=Streptomyces sp. NPDC005568 TaxID=3156887 RepID=UPI0033A085D5